jgi:hypothetical protein
MATTTQRGYGSPHQRARKRWAPVVAAGNARCAEPVCLRSSRWIKPGEAWDLAHGDTRTQYRGPAHPDCNRSEGSRRRWAGSRREGKPAGQSVVGTSHPIRIQPDGDGA